MKELKKPKPTLSNVFNVVLSLEKLVLELKTDMDEVKQRIIRLEFNSENYVSKDEFREYRDDFYTKMDVLSGHYIKSHDTQTTMLRLLDNHDKSLRRLQAA